MRITGSALALQHCKVVANINRTRSSAVIERPHDAWSFMSLVKQCADILVPVMRSSAVTERLHDAWSFMSLVKQCADILVPVMRSSAVTERLHDAWSFMSLIKQCADIDILVLVSHHFYGQSITEFCHFSSQSETCKSSATLEEAGHGCVWPQVLPPSVQPNFYK